MTKKQLMKELESLKLKLEDTSEFKTEQILALEAQLQAARARANVLNSDVMGEATKLSVYNEILDNRIPAKYHWLYWIYINEYADYWVNRWVMSSEKYTQRQLSAWKRILVLYGIAGIHKETGDAYWISRFEGDYVWATKAANMLYDSKFMEYKHGEYSGKQDKIEKLPKDSMVICDFQSGGLGIYIWYLIPLMLYIYTWLMIPANANMLLNKLFYKVNNLAQAKNEIRRILDPTENVIPVIDDKTMTGNNILGTSNSVVPVGIKSAPQIEQIITASKFLQETMHSLYGIPVSSSKNQSLSSDVKLDAGVSDNKAYEHDWRIEEACKELGIKLTINKPEEEDIEPENQNSDKQGEGTANTEGENIKENK